MFGRTTSVEIQSVATPEKVNGITKFLEGLFVQISRILLCH